jgi:tetratricopeptide (TPR) repeat protein
VNKPSLFISFSTTDGRDIAQAVHDHYSKYGHRVFYSPEAISLGKQWSDEVMSSISGCDFFVIIVTFGALLSTEVEIEFLEASRLGKRIVPCRSREVPWTDLKWGLNSIQGIEFENPFDLIRKIDSKMHKESITPSPQGIEPSPDMKLLQYGNQLMSQGKYVDAIQYCDKALEINPSNPLAWDFRGICLSMLGRPADALPHFGKALEINPRDYTALFQTGYALGNLKRYQEAIQYFGKALEINPAEYASWHNVGLNLINLRNYQGAIQCFDKALGINYYLPQTWYWKGVAYKGLSDKKEARKCYDIAKRLSSG